MDVVERSLSDGAAAVPIEVSSDLRGFGKPRRSGSGFQRAKRRAWRMSLRARFLLFQRHRHNAVVLETIAGRPILVLPEVLNPKLFVTGEFLAETLSQDAGSHANSALSQSPSALIPPGSSVLDMGTGSGVGAVFAARRASRVVAVDVNPAAVRCARINALLNHVDDRVEVVEGDLFEPVAGQRFDVILFNPPYFPGKPRTDFERALWSDGLDERFATGLGDHLQPGGIALLLLSSAGEEQAWLNALSTAGYQADAVARRDLLSEVLTIYRVRWVGSLR